MPLQAAASPRQSWRLTGGQPVTRVVLRWGRASRFRHCICAMSAFSSVGRRARHRRVSTLACSRPRLMLCSLLASTLTCACLDVFDYRVDDSQRPAAAATRDDGVMTGSPQGEIWRRSDPRADGGPGPAPDAARGVKTEPAQPSMTSRDPAASSDDDAGLSTEPTDPSDPAAPTGPTWTQPPPSAALAQAGWAALTDWAALPTFTESSARLFSTHERGAGESFPLIDPGNKDFNSFLAVCGEQPSLIMQQNEASVSCGPGELGYLIAADDGPGYVSRILLARGISNPSSSVLVDLRPMDERIRIYIDGAQQPAFDGLWSDWIAGRDPAWSAPLTGWTSGATISYLPISYSRQLRVFVDELTASSLTLYYAHVTTHRVPSTQPFDAAQLASAEARAELEALLARSRSAGASWLDSEIALPGVGAMTVWSREQPGTLARIELQLEAESAAAVMKETSLRVRWDDESPGIDLPLALLFGARHRLAPFTTLPLSVELDGNSARLTLSVPMPFAQRAQIELVNATDTPRTLRVRLYGSDELPRGEWGRLHVALSEQRDPQPGQRFDAAAVSGRGKYLGTLMYMRGKADESRSVRASELGFLEGDERLEIDGQLTALGTGTDNYFNGGFYFKDGPYNAPFAAVSQLDADEDRGVSETTMVRWTILSEQLSFQSQLALSFELGADRPGTVRDYAAVSFYYQ